MGIFRQSAPGEFELNIPYLAESSVNKIIRQAFEGKQKGFSKSLRPEGGVYPRGFTPPEDYYYAPSLSLGEAIQNAINGITVRGALDKDEKTGEYYQKGRFRQPAIMQEKLPLHSQGNGSSGMLKPNIKLQRSNGTLKVNLETLQPLWFAWAQYEYNGGDSDYTKIPEYTEKSGYYYKNPLDYPDGEPIKGKPQGLGNFPDLSGKKPVTLGEKYRQIVTSPFYFFEPSKAQFRHLLDFFETGKQSDNLRVNPLTSAMTKSDSLHRRTGVDWQISETSGEILNSNYLASFVRTHDNNEDDF